MLIGILNLTPNSFSDTGLHFSAEAALAHAKFLMDAGANVLDLGAEASSFFRPGVLPVDPDEQLRRLLPALDALPKNASVQISIDTRSAQVAQACLDRGAHIINDISAGTHDPDLFRIVAKHNASIILMHISPTFPDNPAQSDADILVTVRIYLADRIAAARLAGIAQDKIFIDPGLGFGKTPADNWTLALRAHELQHDLHLPLVLGCSRKRFLESTPPEHLVPAEKWQELIPHFTHLLQIENRKSKIENHPRDPATAALTHLTLQSGITHHRLHNPATYRLAQQSAK